jgi:Acetamidase/Formamidase family
MGLTEIRNICEVSLDIPAEKQEKLHNRWHPDIPFAGTIKNGETVKIECVSRPRGDNVPQSGASHLQRPLGGLDWRSDW